MTDSLRSLASGESEAQTVRAPALSEEPSSGADRLLTISGSEALRSQVLVVDGSSQAAEVKAALDGGKLLCLKEVSPQRVSALHELVGRPDAALAADADVLFYGLQKTARGWARFVEYRATLRERADLQVPPRTTPEAQLLSAARPAEPMPDGFAGWLERSLARHPLHLLGQPSAMDLFQMAESFTDNIYAEVPIKGVMGNTGKTLSLQASIFAVACNVSGTEGADYYCVQMQCVFKPPTGLPSGLMGFWMPGYDVQMSPTDLGNQPQLLTLVSSSPDTTQGESSTSSSTSTSVGGNIGFFGSTATGGVQGSVTFGSSHSFSTPGVVTSNRSGGGPQQAEWLFSVSPDSPVATNSFQPFVQGLWRVSSSAAAELKDYAQLRLNINLHATAWMVLAPAELTIPTHITTVKRPPKYHQDS